MLAAGENRVQESQFQVHAHSTPVQSLVACCCHKKKIGIEVRSIQVATVRVSVGPGMARAFSLGSLHSVLLFDAAEKDKVSRARDGIIFACEQGELAAQLTAQRGYHPKTVGSTSAK